MEEEEVGMEEVEVVAEIAMLTMGHMHSEYTDQATPKLQVEVENDLLHN